jgi:DNA-binding MarR family transcriptional regulator
MGMEAHDAFAPGTNAPRGVQGRLALLAFHAGVEMSARGEAALEELGISGREYTTLAVLADDEPESQQEIAGLLGKAPGVVVAVVDDLEAKGLVERRRSEQDRRRSVVRITPAGRDALHKADAVADEVADAVFAALSPDERVGLHDTLRRALSAQAPAPA